MNKVVNSEEIIIQNENISEEEKFFNQVLESQTDIKFINSFEENLDKDEQKF